MTSPDDERSRHQHILEEARRFAHEEVRPRARDFDERGELARDLIAKMATQGFLLARLPQQYGGLGLDPVTYGLVTEEIGKACCSSRALMTVECSLVGETLLAWGTEDQKRRWLQAIAKEGKLGAFALTEPEIGSDARGVKTTFEARGDDYILNGRKKWTSFGAIADFFLVVAMKDSSATVFLVERDQPGVRVTPMKGLLAGRAAHLAEIELENVCVPKDRMVGKPGSAFPYVVGTALDHGRYSVAWGGVAIAQASLEAMVTYARTRTQFGQKIAEFQLVQGMIGEAVAKIHAARALCLRAGELRQRRDPDAIMETTIAKHFSAQIAMEVATDAVQVHGGNGCSSSYPVERLFREAKVLNIIEGTAQIQQQMIAKYGLRKYYHRPSPE